VVRPQTRTSISVQHLQEVKKPEQKVVPPQQPAQPTPAPVIVTPKPTPGGYVAQQRIVHFDLKVR